MQRPTKLSAACTPDLPCVMHPIGGCVALDMPDTPAPIALKGGSAMLTYAAPDLDAYDDDTLDPSVCVHCRKPDGSEAAA